MIFTDFDKPSDIIQLLFSGVTLCWTLGIHSLKEGGNKTNHHKWYKRRYAMEASERGGYLIKGNLEEVLFKKTF